MTSTLCDASSTNKMDHVVREQVIEMFEKSFTYQQGSNELKERYSGERGFSVSSIKLFCKKNVYSDDVTMQKALT